MSGFTSRIGRDIKTFVSGKDLVILAIGLALSTAFQATIKALIDALIMPFVSAVTGKANLATRAYELQTPKGNKLGIKLEWGKAIESVIVFAITLVVMVEIARLITVKYVKSSSVSFN